MTDYENFPDESVAKRTIALDNAWVIRRKDLTKLSIGTNQELPVTVLDSPAFGWISATRKGAPIDLAIRVTLVLPVPGVALGRIEGPVIGTWLTAYLGREVHEVVQIGDGYLDSVPLLVVATATPEMA